jgi:hypothetical protein
VNKAIGFIFLVCPVCISIFLSGCASSAETERDEEDTRYEEKLVKVIKNLDAVERDYIASSKIRSIEKININLDPEGKISDSKKLSALNYNSNGYLTETIIYDEDGGIKYRFNYEYDKSGRRTRTMRIINGELENYYTYEYNEHGNKSKAMRSNTGGELEEYYLYEYDDEGNLVEEEWFSSDDKKVYSIENDYDDGKKSSSYTYDENGSLSEGVIPDSR